MPFRAPAQGVLWDLTTKLLADPGSEAGVARSVIGTRSRSATPPTRSSPPSMPIRVLASVIERDQRPLAPSDRRYLAFRRDGGGKGGG